MTSVEVVEKIKRLLADPEGITQERLAELADDYAARCRLLNAKLERAVACINSGQLCEADRCERDGGIINEFQTLMFENVEEWQTVCRSLDCKIGALPSRDNGMNLQIFVFAYDEVREDFAKFRRLEMEVAPVKERCDVLYKLVDKFPKCEPLKRELVALEKKRCDEIEDIIRSFDPNKTSQGFIAGVLEELQDKRRITHAPETLLKSLVALMEQANNSVALNNLRNFIGTWAEAKLANNDPAMIACLKQFRTGSHNFAVRFVTNDEREALDVLRRHSENVERQLAAQEELKRKTRELSRAAETATDVNALNDLIEKTEMVADNAKQTIDPSLTRAAVKRVESLQLQSSRRNTVWVVVGAILLILFSCAVLFALRRGQLERDAKKDAAFIEEKLNEFTKEGAAAPETCLEEIKKRIERNNVKNPKFQNFPEYSEALTKYEETLEKENTRAEKFSDEVDRVVALLKKKIPVALNQLKNLQRTEKEKRTYKRLLKEYNVVKLDFDKKNHDIFIESMNRLNELLESYSLLAPAKAEAVLRDMKNEVDFWRQFKTLGKISPEDAQTLDEFEKKFNALKESSKENAAEINLSRELRDAVGKISAFSSILSKAKDSLNDEAKALADNAESDIDNASRADRWNKFVEENDRLMDWAVDAETFNKMNAKRDALAFAQEDDGFRDSLNLWENFAASGGFANVKKNLSDAFKPYATKVWSVKSTPDKYVYLTSIPKDKDDKSVQFLDGAPDKLEFFKVDELPDSTIEQIKEPALQYTLYNEIKSGKTLDDPQKLFRTLIDFASRVMNADENQLDPVLKVVLLNKIIQCGKKSPGWDSVALRMEEAKLDFDFDFDVNIYDYEAVKKQRETAKKLLSDLPNSSDFAKLLYDAASGFAKADSCCAIYRWIGFIDVDSDGARVVLGKSVPFANEETTLWIARGDEPAVQCGVEKDGALLLNQTRDWHSYRWSPVYRRDDI